jgi:glycosyltransferase XagB
MSNLPSVSVIVPALNEAGNIHALISRTEAALFQKATYEIIVIDDRSTDGTAGIVAELGRFSDGRISVHTKQGKGGKAYSLLEGFAYARHDFVCMIDADLQYPPETIPDMLAMAATGADVVVANRADHDTNWLRRNFSKFGRNLYGKWLHGLDCDVQSGLKLFRREITHRVELNPTSWTFDLEFLVQARDAGYQIGTVSIPFAKRASGGSKVNMLGTGLEILGHAVKVKLAGPKVIPVTKDPVRRAAAGFHYKGKHYITHTNLPHHESALRQLTRGQAVTFTATLAALAALLVIKPHATLTTLIGLLTIVYFADLLYNLFLISRSYSHQVEHVITPDELAGVRSRDWPMYTVFCPLYKEWEVLPQFVTAMSRLDYPKDKLQVMLLLEEDDHDTIKHALDMNLPSYFEVVVVPHSKPKTKPKACNYGLKVARGEYVVIFDAEDVPEPTQLKKAVIAFERSTPDVACIQAKLNFYNPRQNLLTRAFTAEYSLWFDLVLTGLQAAHAPIPLGGTSNHFKTHIIRELDGWDAFNVTEDCDLGIRLAKRGYHTSIVDSVTLEEANSDPKNWFWQRTRWIKGYIQSYWVHMRSLREFKLTLREPHAITFQLIVGGKIGSMFINPLMWAITASYFVFRATLGPAIESFYPTPILYMAVTCTVAGNFLYMYYYMLGCAKREQYDLIKYAYLVPVYWAAMSAAAWVALYKLIVSPHQWFKTQHGLHLNSGKAMEQVHATLGADFIDDELSGSTTPAPAPMPSLSRK